MNARIKRADRGLSLARALMLGGAIVLVVVLGYRQFTRMMDERVSVWVSTGPLQAGQGVSAASVSLVRVSSPRPGYLSREQFVGRKLIAAKAAGEPIYREDLEPIAPPPPVASTIPAGRLLATVKINAMDLPTRDLRYGDRIDILQATRDGVRLVAQDAQVMGTLKAPKSPDSESSDSGKVLGVDLNIPGTGTPGAATSPALVLALRPADVFMLTAAESGGARLKLLLHAATETPGVDAIDIRPKAPRPAPRIVTTSVQLLAGAKVETLSFK